MKPEKRKATHPGVILEKDFLIPLKISVEDLSRLLRLNVEEINKIISGKKEITFKIAQILSEILDTSIDLWLNLQKLYDLSEKNKIEEFKDETDFILNSSYILDGFQQAKNEKVFYEYKDVFDS
jgi:addiction module HigA family antidote